MVYFEKCISLVFLSSYFENAWSKLQNLIHVHYLLFRPSICPKTKQWVTAGRANTAEEPQT
jgi:hypothetical protein